MCYTSKAIGPKAHNKTQYTLTINSQTLLVAYCTALIIQSLEKPNFIQWVLAEVAIIEGKGIIA